MKMMSTARLASAMAMAALLAACSDQPMPLAPANRVLTPNSTTIAAAGEGELQLCKTGNGSGTFTFSYTLYLRSDSSFISSGTTSVAIGSCVTLVQLPTVGNDRQFATITETNIPANWSVAGITAANTTPIPIQWGPPVVDIANATVTNAGIANDVGSTVTFDNLYTPPPQGCTYTQGYWKTHSLAGPAPYDPTWALLPGGLGSSTLFFGTGRTYLQIFNTPPAGNAYYQLAHQYMAAELNILGGADPTAAAAAMASAKTLFQTYTPAQVAALPKSSSVRAQFLSLAGTLDKYNTGLIGPGHCGNE